MANRFQNPVALVRTAAFLLGIAGLGGALAEEGEKKATRIGLILEGTFESAEISKPPEGAKQTTLVPFYEWDYGIRPYTKERWDEQRLDWKKVERITRAVADGILEKVEPQLICDERGVIDYIVLESTDPFLTSVLLSDKLLPRFRDTLGDRILAIPVGRRKIYLFPATGGKLDEYGAMIVAAYRQVAIPVSLEVFLLDDEGLRAIGVLDRGSSSR